MSGTLKFRFGPLPHLSVDLRVGEYLRTVRSGPELACLRDFVSNLQWQSIPVGRSVAMDLWHFHVCNHIMEIRVVARDSGVITRIYRGITSDIVSSLRMDAPGAPDRNGLA